MTRGICPGMLAAGVWACVAATACDNPVYRTDPSARQTQPQPVERSLAGYRADFLILWHGARIGDATEVVRRSNGGLRYRRHERLAVRRGDALVPVITDITIRMDATLRAERMDIEQMTGPTSESGHATRDPDTGAWIVETSAGATGRAPEPATPAELVPLRLFGSQAEFNTGDVAFTGPVLLAGYGFALAYMRVVAMGEREFAVTLFPDARTPHAEDVAGGQDADTASGGRWHMTRYGALARVSSGTGVSAIRAHPDELDAPFEAPEIVDSAAIPVAGENAAPGDATATSLVIDSISRAPPPALPGQRIHADGGTWYVQLLSGDAGAQAVVEPTLDWGGPETPGNQPRMVSLANDIVARAGAHDTRAEVVALTRATARLLADALDAPGTHARAALALGRGDCTAHATLFHELARSRDIATRLVTGYRLDGDRLVRHRWAVARIDDHTWIAVDPTYGEAPAAPRLLGLAIHRASAAELSMIDDIAFAGMARARARVAPRAR